MLTYLWETEWQLRWGLASRPCRWTAVPGWQVHLSDDDDEKNSDDDDDDKDDDDEKTDVIILKYLWKIVQQYRWGLASDPCSQQLLDGRYTCLMIMMIIMKTTKK